MKNEASLAEIQNFFAYQGPKEFKDDWGKLNEAERTFFKVEVGKEIHPDGE